MQVCLSACGVWICRISENHVRAGLHWRQFARRQFCLKSTGYGVERESAHCQSRLEQDNNVLELRGQPPTIMCTDCRAP
jgi:hypothetical protein